jgi:hypothetical protein
MQHVPGRTLPAGTRRRTVARPVTAADRLTTFPPEVRVRPWIRYMRDTFRFIHPEQRGDEGTMHSFSGGTGGDRIDWILACRQFIPVAAAIDRTRSGRRASPGSRAGGSSR